MRSNAHVQKELGPSVLENSLGFLGYRAFAHHPLTQVAVLLMLSSSEKRNGPQYLSPPVSDIH